MGGLVFAGGPDPLYTPRMPPGVYQHAKAACHAALQQLFEHVATPIEGPRKARLRSTATDLQSVQWRHDVRAALGAAACVSQQPHAGSFAIYWPEGVAGDIECLDERETPGVPQQRYIQVDVHVCDSPETLRWSVFKNDHGDLWNLLGSTIRPFGLTVDHEALYVRIAEIEKLDKKKAKIRLTSDPDTVLRFLGLDLERWKRPFATMRDTYEYAATCRFFWVKPESSSEGGSDGGGSDADEHRIGGEFTRKDLKSNDRQRMAKRPMFNRWINEFIPACREQHRFTDRQIDRDGTLEEVFAQFGVRETYDARVLEFRKKRQAETIWKDVIKAAVPVEGIAPMFRGGAANGLKKIILQGDESFGVMPSEPLKNEDGLFDEDAVRRFAEANWKKVGDIVSKKNHERMLEKLKKDAERKYEKESSVV
ncbi:uncharacterized protein PG986_011677 [Apiospora aurea]|uniref:Uncharacterized protein n=1 Tax=Apiospora aurea TaxID=335848 RepID=A0ABR1PY71_9PEZI